MTTTEHRTLARENLCRSVPFELVRADEDSDSDGLTIEGYGAVFGAVTMIDSWEGTFEEVIAPGAFRKSLRERTPKMQFDHGRHPLLGSVPLGRWDVAEEDAHGLHVVGRLSDNWLVQPFRDAIRDGGVEGMSFRFSVVREEWRDNSGKLIKADELLDLLWTGGGDRGPIRRTLKELKAPEVGPVVWPAYEETSVGVRSQVVTIDLGRLTDPETRRTLAHAVALVDAANRNTEDDAPPPNQEPPASHPTEASVAPAGDRSSPGEHPSATPQPKGNPAKEFAQHARGYLLSMRGM
jgi:HK97 family phage prohead protease